MANYDVTQASQFKYTRFKQKPTDVPLDYSKFETFNQYIDTLNYQDPNSPIFRTFILRKGLE